ncbi:hypothetical protein GCM10011390_13900 [Aureimonas endophytica]|uniref:Ribonuclease VapC n=1 Tax=Aureimonas endophytica TaxID=2027858 RepID=A0A916ZGH3_9HYPH|nr:hypothetical protein GCM10011390_13900 [Aureimonas endophytica]
MVDSSAWIEWLVGSATGTMVGQELPRPDDWIVPTIVQLELAKWVLREAGEERLDPILAFMQSCRLAVLDTETALQAAEFCRRHRLATADAIVYATAWRRGADLLTCDAHFADLPNVVLIRKVEH